MCANSRGIEAPLKLYSNSEVATESKEFHGYNRHRACLRDALASGLPLKCEGCVLRLSGCAHLVPKIEVCIGSFQYELRAHLPQQPHALNVCSDASRRHIRDSKPVCSQYGRLHIYRVARIRKVVLTLLREATKHKQATQRPTAELELRIQDRQTTTSS